MKRISFLAVITIFLLVVAGCGGGNVDESLLATRIPTLGPEDFVVAAATVEPVATATSQPEPHSPAAATEPHSSAAATSPAVTSAAISAGMFIIF